jgi:hypothetical protein
MSISQKQTPTTIRRRIAQRTRGRKHGPTTRLMSPSDLGELLKPFVFLDLFEHEGPPFEGGLHPHSGIATRTYVTEGSVIKNLHRARLSMTCAMANAVWAASAPRLWVLPRQRTRA